MLSKEHSFSEKACSNVKWILKTTAYQYELSFTWWYDSKNSKQINLTLKASIAYNLNVASFHLLLLQQTICEFLADEGFVNGEVLKGLKGDAGFKGRPHVENILCTVVAKCCLYEFRGGQNPGAAMTSSLYQQNLQSTRKILAQSYFVGKNSDATSVT